MNKIAVVLAAGVCVFAGIASARADGGDPALVKVPFQFIVGDKALPAGDYRIAPQTPDSAVLLVTSTDGKSAAAFAATESVGGEPSQSGPVHVAFKNYDGQYFLWQIAMPNQDVREIRLTRASAERTLVRLNLMPPEHGVAVK